MEKSEYAKHLWANASVIYAGIIVEQTRNQKSVEDITRGFRVCVGAAKEIAELCGIEPEEPDIFENGKTYCVCAANPQCQHRD